MTMTFQGKSLGRILVTGYLEGGGTSRFREIPQNERTVAFSKDFLENNGSLPTVYEIFGMVTLLGGV